MTSGYTVLVLCATIVTASCAGIIETLLSWDPSDSEAGSTTPQSKCLCQTSGCFCCVDLNSTSIFELEGPVCVNIEQKEQNVSLNMSYGENTGRNATIKIADAANKPICMNLLEPDLAQICTKFTSIKLAESGFDGCLVLEPTFLGSSQATYRMGCFNFNQEVRQIAISSFHEAIESSEDEADGLNTDELIAAVSASAQQGIALFSRWLGLDLSPKRNSTNNLITDNGTVLMNETSSRSMKSLPEAQQERRKQNLEQLLIAQDSIVKESPEIGISDGLHTTFVYSKSGDQQRSSESSNAQKLFVSRESRRGGRAYSIHQHVNEV